MIFLVNRSNGVAIYRAKYCTERFERRSKIGRISEVNHVGSGELRTTKGSQTVLLNWEKQMSFVPFTPVHYGLGFYFEENRNERGSCDIIQKEAPEKWLLLNVVVVKHMLLKALYLCGKKLTQKLNFI